MEGSQRERKYSTSLAWHLKVPLLCSSPYQEKGRNSRVKSQINIKYLNWCFRLAKSGLKFYLSVQEFLLAYPDCPDFPHDATFEGEQEKLWEFANIMKIVLFLLNKPEGIVCVDDIVVLLID